MKRIMIVLTLVLAVGVGPAVAQSEERKSILFDQLMKVMGGADLVKKIHDDLIRSLPPDQAARLARAFDPEELLAVIRPIYLKYLSEHDLRAIIRFYRSPAGHRLLSIRPQLMAEVLEAVSAYTRRKLGLAPSAARPAPAPPPAPMKPSPAPAPLPAPVKPSPDTGSSTPAPTGSSRPVTLPPPPPPSGTGTAPGAAPDGGAPARPLPDAVKPAPSSEVLSPPLR
jgi:hypothetical protein